MIEALVAVQSDDAPDPISDSDRTWNIYQRNTQTDNALVDVDGNPTAWSYQNPGSIPAFNNSVGEQTGGTSTDPTSGDAEWAYYPDVSNFVRRTDPGNSDRNRILFTGLDQNTTYTIEFYPFHTGVSGDRLVELSIDNFATVSDSVASKDNRTEVLSVTTEPDSSGEVMCYVRDPDTENPGNRHFAAFRIYELSDTTTPGIPATTLDNADGTLSTGTEVTRTITLVSDGTELFTGSQTSDATTGELPEIDLSETAGEVDEAVDDKVKLSNPSNPGIVSKTVRRNISDLGA